MLSATLAVTLAVVLLSFILCPDFINAVISYSSLHVVKADDDLVAAISPHLHKEPMPVRPLALFVSHREHVYHSIQNAHWDAPTLQSS